MNRYREYLSDEVALADALARAATTTEPLWDLAIASHQMIVAKRYADALRVFDVIVDRRTLDLSAYCNALWVVQHDNTGRAVDVERSRRYLRACLIHAPMNPAIHLNAAGVLIELHEYDRAIDQLMQASRRSVALDTTVNDPLLEPLRAHPRWAELSAAAQPMPRFEASLVQIGLTPPSTMKYEFDAWALKSLPPDQVAAALELCMEHEDPRLRHRAARQLIWWRDEDGDDGHGGFAPEPLLTWYGQLGDAIAERLSTERFVGLVERDLPSAFVHDAAYTFDIIVRNPSWERITSAVAPLGPHIEVLLRAGDDAVKHQLADGLFWISAYPDAEAMLRSHVVAPLSELIDDLAGGESLSDIPKVQREQLRHAVKVLDDLNALGPCKASLVRIVAGARGETWDKYLRSDLAKLIDRL